jgi:hypothetical protein
MAYIAAAYVVSWFGRVVVSVSGFPFMFGLGCAFASAFAFGPVDIVPMVTIASVVTRLAVAVDMDLLGVQVVRLQMETYLVSQPPGLFLLTWGGCWDGQRRTMVVVMRRKAWVTRDIITLMNYQTAVCRHFLCTTHFVWVCRPSIDVSVFSFW